ncbi:hypothetical protein COOONC_16065 [Cooperia oncophora]
MRRHPAKRVCFPGGMRDADENLQETAIREAEESAKRLPELPVYDDGTKTASELVLTKITVAVLSRY